MAKPIRLKHQLFVHHYLACSLNGAQAARDAGYSRKNARHYASRLLRKANVREYLAAQAKATIDRHNAEAAEYNIRLAAHNRLMAEVRARQP